MPHGRLQTRCIAYGAFTLSHSTGLGIGSYHESTVEVGAWSDMLALNLLLGIFRIAALDSYLHLCTRTRSARPSNEYHSKLQVEAAM